MNSKLVSIGIWIALTAPSMAMAVGDNDGGSHIGTGGGDDIDLAIKWCSNKKTVLEVALGRAKTARIHLHTGRAVQILKKAFEQIVEPNGIPANSLTAREIGHVLEIDKNMTTSESMKGQTDTLEARYTLYASGVEFISKVIYPLDMKYKFGIYKTREQIEAENSGKVEDVSRKQEKIKAEIESQNAGKLDRLRQFIVDEIDWFQVSNVKVHATEIEPGSYNYWSSVYAFMANQIAAQTKKDIAESPSSIAFSCANIDLDRIIKDLGCYFNPKAPAGTGTIPAPAPVTVAAPAASDTTSANKVSAPEVDDGCDIQNDDEAAQQADLALQRIRANISNQCN